MVCAIATTASTHFQSFFPNLQDEEAQREFDELMRSSTTMKVSLTPDRLKSMEVRDSSDAEEREREGASAARAP